MDASPSLASTLSGAATTAYWSQTGMIAGLLVALVVLYRTSRARGGNR